MSLPVMGATVLPTGPRKQRGDGVLQPRVGIGDDQFHPAFHPAQGQPPEWKIGRLPNLALRYSGNLPFCYSGNRVTP